MTERTYNKLWQACSQISVPNQPRFSPRRSSCREKCDRQIPASACWDRYHRMPMIPRSLSWQCYSLNNPEVLSINLRPNTNERLSVSPDYQRRLRTLTKRFDDLLRSQVFPDPLSVPPLVYLCDETGHTHLRRYKSRASSKIHCALNSNFISDIIA